MLTQCTSFSESQKKDFRMHCTFLVVEADSQKRAISFDNFLVPRVHREAPTTRKCKDDVKCPVMPRGRRSHFQGALCAPRTRSLLPRARSHVPYARGVVVHKVDVPAPPATYAPPCDWIAQARRHGLARPHGRGKHWVVGHLGS